MKNSVGGVIQKSGWELFDLILFTAFYLAELFPREISI